MGWDYVEGDIDVVVELKTQDLFDLIGIKLDLEEQLSQEVDIVSYRKKMNNFLKRRIDKEAVYV
jgi:predicted nucleotidyltransferase